MADGGQDMSARWGMASHGPRDPIEAGFSHGDKIAFVDDEHGEANLIIGHEYCDRRTLDGDLKTCVLIGASGPALWDDLRDKWIDTTAERAEAYIWAVIKWADGTVTALDPNYLWGPHDDAARLPAPPLSFLSYDDMLAMPDPVWLVEGVIQQATSALLFGRSNAFKSFLGIDIAAAIATGTPWHGFEVSGPAPVLYVATEGSRGVGKQRIPGWHEAHGIPLELRRNLQLYPQEIALDDEAAVSELLASCAHWKAVRTIANGGKVWNEKDPAGSVALIVVDIFGASMNGSEITDETARAWVRSVNRIMREIGCAVLTVAHTGWADETRARMHTHFWGSFDTRLKAEGDKDSLTTVLSVDRHKDADSTGEWGFRLEVVDTPTGGTTLVPRLCDEVETKQKRRVSGKPAVALQALSEALIEHGRTIAGPNYPARPIVTVEQWRAMCDRHGLTESDNPETVRKAFNRAKDALIAKGLVREFDRNVWKVEADD